MPVDIYYLHLFDSSSKMMIKYEVYSCCCQITIPSCLYNIFLKKIINASEMHNSSGFKLYSVKSQHMVIVSNLRLKLQKYMLIL